MRAAWLVALATLGCVTERYTEKVVIVEVGAQPDAAPTETTAVDSAIDTETPPDAAPDTIADAVSDAPLACMGDPTRTLGRCISRGSDGGTTACHHYIATSDAPSDPKCASLPASCGGSAWEMTEKCPAAGAFHGCRLVFGEGKCCTVTTYEYSNPAQACPPMWEKVAP